LAQIVDAHLWYGSPGSRLCLISNNYMGKKPRRETDSGQSPDRITVRRFRRKGANQEKKRASDEGVGWDSRGGLEGLR